MKKICTIFAAILFTASVFAQAPQKMSYQAVIHTSSNALVTSASVGMKVSILQGSAAGVAVFVETHTPTTNANGLASLEIGGGTAVTGTMSGIDWSAGPYFIKTETDPTGGTNYTITGTSQLLSVPYALHSNCVPVSVSGAGDTLTIGCHSVIIPGISAANVVLPTYPAGSVFCTSGPTAIVDVTNPTTGKTWMDRNLGASQAATSSTDDAAYGDLYQWGRRADGHQCRTSPTTATLSSIDQPAHGNFILAPSIPYDWRSTSNDNLWQGVNGVNNPCPSGYRLATAAEFEAERLSWSESNTAGAFASSLKLPIAGFRMNHSGQVFGDGNGRYWSGSFSTNTSLSFHFFVNSAGMGEYGRAYGMPVRCIKD
jgi:uncharacterized protein (TIGR02145 family)